MNKKKPQLIVVKYLTFLIAGVVIGYILSNLLPLKSKLVQTQIEKKSDNYAATTPQCLRWYENPVTEDMTNIEIWVENTCKNNSKRLGEVSDPLGLINTLTYGSKTIFVYPYAGSYLLTEESMEHLNLLNEYWDSERIIGWLDNENVVGVTLHSNPDIKDKSELWTASLKKLSDKKVLLRFDSPN